MPSSPFHEIWSAGGSVRTVVPSTVTVPVTLLLAFAALKPTNWTR